MFTDSDIENLKEAKEALHKIECTNVNCGNCPLFIGNGCIVNHLGYIIKKSEEGRLW
jgi:hypothetical protein